MEIILSTPFVARVIVSLFMILAINKMIGQLSISVIIGTIILALWSGQDLNSMVSITIEKVTSLNTLFLMIVIFQVITLSNQMSLTGIMKELVGAIKSVVPQRVSIALLPAVIGLLPMPGGAIFSAPLVDECDDTKSIEPILKTKINYWFRHVWEFWWPLYPGVLLALDLTNISIVAFMLLHLPLSICAIISGYFFLLKKIPINIDEKKKNNASVIDVLSLISPIILIIFIFALIKIFLPAVIEYSKYLPVIIGIIITMVYLQIRRPLDLRSWIKILFMPKTYLLIFLVVTILIYGAFVDAKLPDGTTMMSHVRLELNSWGVPIFIVIMILPFVTGLTTGITVGFVGASFPIVISLIGKDPHVWTLYSTILLAYGSGLMGVMLSPIHVCLVVTNEHFDTNLGLSLLGLGKLTGVVMGFIVLAYFIINMFII